MSGLRAAAAALLAGGALSCAGTGGYVRPPPQTGPNTVVVYVRNDLIPRTEVFITVGPRSRPSQLLGTVHADQTASFEVDTRRLRHSWILMAEKSAGGFVVSERIALVSFATLEWRLSENRVRMERTRARIRTEPPPGGERRPRRGPAS